MASGDHQRARRRRDYRPTVEGLEALRLLSAAQARLLPGMVDAGDSTTGFGLDATTAGSDAHAALVSNDAWDAALGHTRLADLLAAPAAFSTTTAATPAELDSGLSQLNRYLNRAWSRAGVSAQADDSTQAVYAAMLQQLGRSRFDALVGDVGRWGIREVFTRETSDGIAFFRAVDMVKKRAQRERVHQSIENIDVPASRGTHRDGDAMRAALQDAISQSLNPREAALIHDTLLGKTPAEIAQQWGVAPKTVSNEKSRVLQKLREALIDHELN